MFAQNYNNEKGVNYEKLIRILTKIINLLLKNQRELFMYKIKKLFFLITALIAITFSNVKAGNHTIYATIEVSETAINRFLNTQYNSIGFPCSFNVPGTGRLTFWEFEVLSRSSGALENSFPFIFNSYILLLLEPHFQFVPLLL